MCINYQWHGSWADTLAQHHNPITRAYILADRSINATSKTAAMEWLESAHNELGTATELDRYTLAAIHEAAESLKSVLDDGGAA